MNSIDMRERLRTVQRQVQARAQAQRRELGWPSVASLFEAFAREQRLETLSHTPAAHARAALALLRYPPELATALAEHLPTLQPPLRYNPFGATMLALAQLDTLTTTTATQRERAGEVLALVMLADTPSPRWAHAAYAGTPFDARIRAELDRSLRQHDPELARLIISHNPPPLPWAEMAWFRHVQPAVALAFMAKYLAGVLTPPFVNASVGAYLGQIQRGDWTIGWFWGLTAGIAVAVILQQALYRPMLRRLVEN